MWQINVFPAGVRILLESILSCFHLRQCIFSFNQPPLATCARCPDGKIHNLYPKARRNRHREDRPFLPKFQRQTLCISRTRILESAIKVMELYGASPSVFEVEDVGIGLGPTLEFYFTVSKLPKLGFSLTWIHQDRGQPSCKFVDDYQEIYNREKANRPCEIHYSPKSPRRSRGGG